MPILIITVVYIPKKNNNNNRKAFPTVKPMCLVFTMFGLVRNGDSLVCSLKTKSTLDRTL